jgi:hypothetical protein
MTGDYTSHRHKLRLFYLGEAQFVTGGFIYHAGIL